VPTLNEAENIRDLLNSLAVQTYKEYEVILVDGGSADDTVKLAEQFTGKVYVIKGMKEFEARNYGTIKSVGSVLIFTCADVIFPKTLLQRVRVLFEANEDLMAVTCQGIPYDGNTGLKLEYGIYNFIRLVTSKLPSQFKRFSTSTNFLAVKREAFVNLGGFQSNDINADGRFGAKLVRQYRVVFDKKSCVYISARRMKKWGLLKFTMHYVYILENFFPTFAHQKWFMQIKKNSLYKHSEIHSAQIQRQ
jgi:glycosyltransferase involved in cell wall biosynthesis